VRKPIAKTIQDIALYGGQIAILVAHRLLTIQYADSIFVMEDGHMAETGSHKELLAKKACISLYGTSDPVPYRKVRNSKLA